MSVCGYLGDGGVPVSHQQLVEALIPEEASREEGSRWYRCVQLSWPVVLVVM